MASTNVPTSIAGGCDDIDIEDDELLIVSQEVNRAEIGAQQAGSSSKMAVQHARKDGSRMRNTTYAILLMA